MQQFSRSKAGSSSEAPRLSVFDPDSNGDALPVERPATAGAGKRKPRAKTKEEFPLWQRSDGRWCRKIGRTFHYFGKDKDAALDEWLRVKDDLFAGRPRPASGEGLPLVDLCERFLQAKEQLLNTGELSRRTFTDYKQTTDRLMAVFGGGRLVESLRPGDFEKLRERVSKTRGLVGLSNAIRLTRIVFKYASDSDLIEKPVSFGPLFRTVKRKTIRKAKAASNAGARMFTVAEARSIVKAADDTMKAMILLGLNCAFGQSDISALPKSALDLTKGWVNFPRVKTAAPRNIPLWPETVAAVKRAIAGRPAPADPGHESLVFITKYGNPWTRVGPKGGPIDSVGLEFGKLLTELKIKRPGLNFYALRHTFSTVSSDACDQIATNAVMGHLPESDEVPGRYREFVAEERLRKVTEFVRVWLFPAKKAQK